MKTKMFLVSKFKSQVASLAIASANGLLMKGGKEATHSNKALMGLVRFPFCFFTNLNALIQVSEALGRHGCSDAISLVSGRDEVSDLLKVILTSSTLLLLTVIFQLDSYIDLIIPRGSNELVKSIKERSKSIPVLGHADGICHTYLDQHADLEKVS